MPTITKDNPNFDELLDMVINIMPEYAQIENVEAFKRSIEAVEIGDNTMALKFRKGSVIDVSTDAEGNQIVEGSA